MAGLIGCDDFVAFFKKSYGSKKCGNKYSCNCKTALHAPNHVFVIRMQRCWSEATPTSQHHAFLPFFRIRQFRMNAIGAELIYEFLKR